MAAIVIDNKRTTTLEFTAPDTAVVTATGEIAVDGDCIFSTNGDVQVLGQVHTTGTAGTAIHFTKGRVKVEAGGLVSGHSNGVLLDTSSWITNLGTIASAGRAIVGAQNLLVETSGTIEGGEIGIEGLDSGAVAGALTIKNAGTIRGGLVAIRGASRNDYVENTGRIEGGMSLNGGDDSYQGATGTVTGVIDLGEGNDQAFGGLGNEIFHGAGGDDTIFGGHGVDTVIYTGGADLKIDLGKGGRQNTGQGWDTLRDIENVWSGNGHDLIGGSAYANTLSGNGGNDRILGQEGNDVLNGGLGSDLLDGSIGTDTALFAEGSLGATVNLSLTGAQDTGMGSDTLKSIENLIGGAGDDRFTGDGSSNVFTGGGGNDTLAGGGGTDTATFSGARLDYLITKTNGTVTVKDMRAGQDGTDTLTDIAFAKFGDGVTADLRNKAPDSFRLDGSEIAENTQVGTVVSKLTASDPDGDAVTFSLEGDAGGFFKLEGGKLILARALDYEAVSKHSIVIRVTDEYDASTTWNVTLNVRDIDEAGSSGSGPTDPASLILYGTPRPDALTGGGGNDAIWGLSGNDRLRGEAGNDRLCGGRGKDKLWGGSGLDIFVFDSKPNKKTNLDKIVDFNVADDTIHLARSVFSKIGKKGVLKKSAFHVGTDAHDATDRVIYNKKTGALFYDRDGNGDAAQVQIATLSKKLKAISNGDFFIT